jgi:hypothetical protein
MQIIRKLHSMTCCYMASLQLPKALGKLGNIVAETLVTN